MSIAAPTAGTAVDRHWLDRAAVLAVNTSGQEIQGTFSIESSLRRWEEPFAGGRTTRHEPEWHETFEPYGVRVYIGGQDVPQYKVEDTYRIVPVEEPGPVFYLEFRHFGGGGAEPALWWQRRAHDLGIEMGEALGIELVARLHDVLDGLVGGIDLLGHVHPFVALAKKARDRGRVDGQPQREADQVADVVAHVDGGRAEPFGGQSGQAQ